MISWWSMVVAPKGGATADEWNLKLPLRCHKNRLCPYAFSRRERYSPAYLQFSRIQASTR